MISLRFMPGNVNTSELLISPYMLHFDKNQYIPNHVIIISSYVKVSKQNFSGKKDMFK